MERVLPLLRAGARGVSRDPSLIEDAVQEALLVLYRRLPELDFTAAELRSDADAERAIAAWLARTAELTARGLLRATTRRHRRERGRETLPTASAPAADGDERAGLIRALLAELPAPQREIVERRILHGEDTASIATSLGISANAAAVRLHRALATLRERCLARDPSLAGLLFLLLLRQGQAEAAEEVPTSAATAATASFVSAPALSVGLAIALLTSAGLLAWSPQANASSNAIVTASATSNAARPTPLAAAWYAAGASLLGDAVHWRAFANTDGWAGGGIHLPGLPATRSWALDGSEPASLALAYAEGGGEAAMLVTSDRPTAWRWGESVEPPAWARGWTPPQPTELPAGTWIVRVELLRVSAPDSGTPLWEWRCSARQTVVGDRGLERLSLVLLGHGLATQGSLRIDAATPTRLRLEPRSSQPRRWGSVAQLEPWAELTADDSEPKELHTLQMHGFSIQSGLLHLEFRPHQQLHLRAGPGPVEAKFHQPKGLHSATLTVTVAAPLGLAAPHFVYGRPLPGTVATAATASATRYYHMDGWWQAPGFAQRFAQIRGPEGLAIDTGGGLRFHLAAGAEAALTQLQITQDAGSAP